MANQTNPIKKTKIPYPDNVKEWGLREIAQQLRFWTWWTEGWRKKESIETDGYSKISTLPTPYLPSLNQIKDWIKVLIKAIKELESNNPTILAVNTLESISFKSIKTISNKEKVKFIKLVDAEEIIKKKIIELKNEN